MGVFVFAGLAAAVQEGGAKQLRLIDARRLMTSDGASSAASSVGYESVEQFAREYRRMFRLPPAKDTDATRLAANAYA